MGNWGSSQIFNRSTPLRLGTPANEPNSSPPRLQPVPAGTPAPSPAVTQASLNAPIDMEMITELVDARNEIKTLIKDQSDRSLAEIEKLRYINKKLIVKI